MATTETYPKRKSARRPLKSGQRVARCLNCGAELIGKFCVECGQSANTGRLGMKTAAGSMASGVASLERGYLFTLKTLFKRPEMIKDYIRGRRINYSNPFALLFILCAVYGIVMALIGRFRPDAASSLAMSLDSREYASMLNASSEEMARYTRWIYKNYILITLISMPITALAMQIVQPKHVGRRYRYAEMLFASAYILCMYVAVNMLTLPLQFLIMSASADMLALFSMLIFLLVYARGLSGVFGGGWLKALWKSVLVNVLQTIMSIIATTVVAVAVAILIIIMQKG